MPLPTNHVIGDTGLTSSIDAIAVQVNANTASITAFGVPLSVKTTGVTSAGIWIQASDPDTTNPGAAVDGDLWVYPAA